MTARHFPAFRRIAPIRLIVFFAVLLAGDIGAQLLRVWVTRHATSGNRDWAVLGISLVLAGILVALYVGLVRGFERRRAHEITAFGSLVLAGVASGFALFSTVFLVLYAVGIAHWQGLSGHLDAIPPLAAAIVAAVGEELAFRGGVFRIIEDSMGTAAALTLSAALFGLLHVLNPGATLISTAAIALEAGILLGAAYAVTRNLWFPIGLHLGWNFTEGGVFGASVSGYSAGKGILAFELSGPPLLTGGKFGPEASIVAVGVCMITAIALLIWAVRKGRWRFMRVRVLLDP